MSSRVIEGVNSGLRECPRRLEELIQSQDGSVEKTRHCREVVNHAAAFIHSSTWTDNTMAATELIELVITLFQACFVAASSKNILTVRRPLCRLSC